MTSRWKVTAPDGRVYFVYANRSADRDARCDATGIPKLRTTEPAGTYNRTLNVIECGDA